MRIGAEAIGAPPLSATPEEIDTSVGIFRMSSIKVVKVA
jgi:hypothetical protein